MCSVFKSAAPWPQTHQLCHNDNALISIRNWLCKAGSEARGALMRSLTADPGSSVVQIFPDTAVGWTHSYIVLQHRWKDSTEAFGEEGGAGPGLCWLQRWTCGSRSLLLQPPPNSSIAAIFRPFQHFPLAISWRRFGHVSFCLAGVSGGAVTLWSTSSLHCSAGSQALLAPVDIAQQIFVRLVQTRYVTTDLPARSSCLWLQDSSRCCLFI